MKTITINKTFIELNRGSCKDNPFLGVSVTQ